MHPRNLKFEISVSFRCCATKTVIASLFNYVAVTFFDVTFSADFIVAEKLLKATIAFEPSAHLEYMCSRLLLDQWQLVEGPRFD